MKGPWARRRHRRRHRSRSSSQSAAASSLLGPCGRWTGSDRPARERASSKQHGARLLLRRLPRPFPRPAAPRPLVCVFRDREASSGFPEALTGEPPQTNHTPCVLRAPRVSFLVCRAPRPWRGVCGDSSFPLYHQQLPQPYLEQGDGPIVLVLAPTRELALQIKQECVLLPTTLRVHACFLSVYMPASLPLATPPLTHPCPSLGGPHTRTPPNQPQPHTN